MYRAIRIKQYSIYTYGNTNEAKEIIDTNQNVDYIESPESIKPIKRAAIIKEVTS
jgi:hypothetical protein